MKGVFCTILLFCILGCSNNKSRSSGVLPREKMQEVMWDIIGADVFTEQFIKKDSLKNLSFENMQLQNKIFAIHKITKVEFYRSYKYYLAHADQMKIILDSITSKAERERTKMLDKHYNTNSQ